MRSNIVLLGAYCALLLMACTSVKSSSSGKTDKTSTIVSGTVEQLEYGKDGYTATIRTPNDQLFVVTISIPNLGNPDSFQEITVGKQVAVKGDYWKSGSENRLTVRKIISIDNEKFELNGKVQSLEHGTDGYTAQVLGNDQETYYATVSIPNLGENHENFKAYKPGDPVTFLGELWLLGTKLQLTVRDIKM